MAAIVVEVKPAVKAALVARWSLKLVSLLELSVQLRVTVALVAVAVTDVTVRLDGAAGTVVLMVNVFE